LTTFLSAGIDNDTLEGLLQSLENENDLVSVKDGGWGSPSAWLRDWIEKAHKQAYNEAQKELLSEIQRENEMVSPKDPWASPSHWMREWIAKVSARRVALSHLQLSIHEHHEQYLHCICECIHPFCIECLRNLHAARLDEYSDTA
jgi:hypothetical protein